MLQASQLYSLGLSSICIIEVETALLYYPSTKIDNELISGLKFGFKLHYSALLHVCSSVYEERMFSSAFTLSLFPPLTLPLLPPSILPFSPLPHP